MYNHCGPRAPKELQQTRTQILNILQKKKFDEKIEVRGLTQGQIDSMRPGAISMGFNFRCSRAPNGGKYLSKVDLRLQNVQAQKRREIIAERVEEGCTYAEIAAEFKVSRQRIEQEIRAYETCVNLPISLRSAALDEAVKPYLKHVSLTTRCMLCHEDQRQGAKRTAGLCQKCRSAITIRMETASRLRSFLRTKDRHMASEALLRIRRYGLKPEHMIDA